MKRLKNLFTYELFKTKTFTSLNMLTCRKRSVLCFTFLFVINIFCYFKVMVNETKLSERRPNDKLLRNEKSYNTSMLPQEPNKEIKRSELLYNETRNPNQDLGFKSGSNRHYMTTNSSSFMSQFMTINLYIALVTQNPFDYWFFRNRFKSYHDLGLQGDPRIKGLHAGNPNRLKNVILKAIRGEPIHVVVIGGSNSAGGGIGEDEKSLEGLYFNVFADYWGKIFGEFNVKIHKLALGGTGSALFSFCFKTFLDDPNAIDLVLVETAVNFDRNSSTAAEPAEQLIRVLLFSPTAPAVLFINLVSGLGKDPNTGKTINPTCSNLEDYGLVEISQHYNVTAFSLRDIVCRKKGKKREILIPNMTSSDSRHVGIKAHGIIAMMLITYTIDNLKEVIYDLYSNRIYVMYKLLTIPDILFIKKSTAVVSSPLCWTAVTPNHFGLGNHPSLNLEITQNSGFLFQDTFKVDTTTLRTDAAQNGWATSNSSNMIRFSFNVPPWKPGYKVVSRSIIIVIRTSGYGGIAEIFTETVQGRKYSITVNCKSIFGQNRLYTVATRVHPGKHSLTVKVVKDGMFMVSGVLIGPPDFKRLSL